MHSPISNFFRPAFEARSAIVWALSVLYVLLLLIFLRIGVFACLGMAGLGLLMMAWRARQANELWTFKINLAGKPIEMLPSSALARNTPELDANLWLGWGYRWQPKHTQLAFDVLSHDLQDIYPPQWFLKLRGVRHDPREAKGLSWVQGLDKESDVLIPYKALEGHTAIMAITGAIKTTLFRLMVYQLAKRGDVVVVLDPKGDKDLKAICRDVPAMLGTPEKFVMFHPAFSQQSFRFDALASWDRETQVASRIRMIMSASEDDNFVSFVWMTVTHIVGCAKRIGKRISIATLLDYVQSQAAAEALAELVLSKFLSDFNTQFEAMIQSRVREVESENKKPKGKGSQIASPRLAAMAEYFKFSVPEHERPREISGLIAALESNREWFAKMIISLTPILTKLSAGDLGPLLSPDYLDIEDKRPILTSRKLIDGGYVAYMGLDALSDSSVAEAIASMVLADFASTAGEIYNYEDPRSKTRKIHIICDEWGDIVCEPIIQLANKARGAGVVLYLAGQTMSDLIDKMGDQNKAKRVLGNMNNLIIGATSDPDTLDLIATKFGETTVRKIGISQSSGQKTEDAGLEYSASRGTTIGEKDVDLIPPNLVMSLPDLHYVAVVNRAQVIKGRIPVLELSKVNA